MKVPAPPTEAHFTSRLRSASVAARVGLWLGICFGICFVTGLISHYSQDHSQPIPFPTSPSWGYRLTQGLHVTSGTAAVPLLLVKLWSVYPRLFMRPPKDVRKLALDLLEKGSIGVLVAAAIFELASGLANWTEWYPFDYSFRPTHYAIGWITIGALVVHIGVKLPIIRSALGSDVESTDNDRPSAVESSALSRRGLLRLTWVATGVAVVATVGNTVPLLSRVSVLAPHSGDGPAGLPVTKSAAAARVLDLAVDPAYRLTIKHGAAEKTFSLDELKALPQTSRTLPIACVEGWSENADWTGVRLRDLLATVDAPSDADVVVSSLQPSGPFRVTLLQSNFAHDDNTLLALRVNGVALPMDHGYPCRLIAPDRPGVLQTKWVKSVEVAS